MDIDAICSQLGIKPADLARKLDVSDGHLADIKSGRRTMTLEMASKIESFGAVGVIAQVVRMRTAA